MQLSNKVVSLDLASAKRLRITGLDLGRFLDNFNVYTSLLLRSAASLVVVGGAVRRARSSCAAFKAVPEGHLQCEENST